MRKIIYLILVLFVSINMAFALEENIPVKFIYLNGSNTNTEDSMEDFVKGINAVHPYIKASLESSDFVLEHMLKNGKLYIEGKPETFFWGFESLDDLNTMDESLNIMSVISPRLAQTVRSFISHCMHDAIWVQKTYNMNKVLTDLHKSVLSAFQNGEKVVMLGYSAGSFVTYEYLVHKLPAIALNDEYSGVKNTCFDAITASGLAIYSADGSFIKSTNENHIKNSLKNLNEYTKQYCAPEGTVLGVINYASPLALFYSDMNNKSLEITNYNSYLFKYLKDNDVFLLTVNFAEDPMGFPIANNVNVNDVEKLINIKFSENGKGFFYTKSDVKSPATFIGAHLSYWNHPKKFARMITDGYIEGYKNFYKIP